VRRVSMATERGVTGRDSRWTLIFTATSRLRVDVASA